MKHIFIAICLVLAGCQAEKPKQELTPVKTGTYLDWAGTYIGVVPCADCEGIETILTLQRNNAYRLLASYLGKSQQAIIKTGKFSWNQDSTIVILDGITDGPAQYLVGQNVLLQLDLQGQRITGELADKYRLVRTVESILALSRWNLSELLGKYFERSAAHIRFNPDAQEINGYGWCNTFSGSYRLQGDQIHFGIMIPTLRTCPDTTVEKQLLNVFQVVNTYKLEGNLLTLSRDGTSPMAKFEATPGR